MADNFPSTSGIPKAYTLERGNAPVKPGLYIGEVRNNIDSGTRSGRLQVWIKDFGGSDKNNPKEWNTVSPVSPFYGYTNPPVNQETGEGQYVLNKQSYGMWFTSPDIGTEVICFFASADASYGYYLGSVVPGGLNHMLPAIGATTNYKLDNSNQNSYFENAPQLPVVELNVNNQQIDENPRFWEQKKPVHSVVAATMLQQGLIKDPVRGPIGSNAQRESPSAVYGISTPGRPIYQGGMSEEDIQQKLNSGSLNLQDATIIARRGGHSFVMDDGNLTGQDQLVRIRTAKGHQITMSDSGDCFFIIHANGQTWLEFGSEGTVDVYATNSINLRSQGDINIHADRNINMNAKGAFNIKANQQFAVESNVIQMKAEKAMLLYSDSYVGIKSDGTLSLKASRSGTWGAGDQLTLSAGCIALNSGDAPDVPKPSDIAKQNLPDVKFETNKGWVVQPGALQTIVNRAPTHQPYPYQGQGVAATTSVEAAQVDTTVAKEVDEKYVKVQDAKFDPIDVKDYETQNPAVVSVGSIQPDQVTGMLAQSSKNVGQEYYEFSEDKGLGKYGFTAEQLEAAGYLKPGTVEFYLSDGLSTPTDVLNSPSVWTGQNNVTNIGVLLGDSKLQDSIQTGLYQESLTDLRKTGVVTGNEDPAKLAGLVQATSKYGAETVNAWVKNQVSDSTVVDDINGLVRGGQYSVELANQKINDAQKGYSTVPVTSTNTVNRKTVDAAVKKVINNDKVPGPVYSITQKPG